MDEVDFAAVGYAVEYQMVVERGGPFGVVRRLQLKRTQQNFFEFDGLVVDPGVGVVELELVNSSLGGHEVGPERAAKLLLAHQQSLPRSLVSYLPKVVQLQIDIMTLHLHRKVQQRIILNNLESSDFALLVSDTYGLADPQVGIRRKILLGISHHIFI